MCGIIGYAGEQNTGDILIEGLKRLEYRGYDSAGVAVQTESGITLCKTAGRISDLEAQMKIESMPEGLTGIGHTRWATHGQPTVANAHPHACGQVTLVHNGILENAQSIREEMESKGYVFASETDTESAAVLLADLYREMKDPVRAITALLEKIKGSYALAILFADRPGKIFAVRQDSPLIVGIGEKENFLASDIPAILPYTRRYCLPANGDIIELDAAEIKRYTRTGVPFADLPEILTANWDALAADRGGYPFFMRKEIDEQTAILRHLAVRGLPSDFPSTVGIKRLRIAACGSAMHAGLLGARWIEQWAKIPVTVLEASEFRYTDPLFLPGDAVLVISQSGETADTLAALRLAKENGVPVFAIVNVPGSTIARESDTVLYIDAGPEIAVATTKAFCAQVMVLWQLACRMGEERGTLSPAAVTSISETLRHLPAAVEAVLQVENKTAAVAESLASHNDVFFIARGQDCGMAREGTLKLKEISYLHAEFYPAGELKHGTISLIGQGTPVVALMTDPLLAPKMIANIREVQARGAAVLLLAPRSLIRTAPEILAPSEGHPQAIPFVLPEPISGDVGALPLSLAALVALQLIAYHTALLLGRDVDKPQNLAKSVTVE